MPTKKPREPKKVQKQYQVPSVKRSPAILDTWNQSRFGLTVQDVRRVRRDPVLDSVYLHKTILEAVNLSSIAAMGTSFVGNTFYGATKAAALLLTRRFAMDLGSFGITVNAIARGFIVTDMVRQGRSPEDAEALIGRIAEKAMTRRTSVPEDIAHAVSFLVSPQSGFVTAQTLTVDGGRMDCMNPRG